MSDMHRVVISTSNRQELTVCEQSEARNFDAPVRNPNQVKTDAVWLLANDMSPDDKKAFLHGVIDTWHRTSMRGTLVELTHQLVGKLDPEDR